MCFGWLISGSSPGAHQHESLENIGDLINWLRERKKIFNVFTNPLTLKSHELHNFATAKNGILSATITENFDIRRNINSLDCCPHFFEIFFPAKMSYNRYLFPAW